MNRYERLNQERKISDKKKRVAAYCRVSTRQTLLKASRDILRSILSAIPIGSFTRYLQRKAFLAQTQKNGKSLTVWLSVPGMEILI